MQNYHGSWIGNQELTISKSVYKNIDYILEQVTLENLSEITEQIKLDRVGILSVGLDGNDWHFVNSLLRMQSLKPETFIVEYNSSYKKNVEHIMDYNASHVWDGSNNFGASLLSYKKLFKKFDYFCCAVNLTGVNAFFVKCQYRDKFNWQIENSDKIYKKQFKYYKEYRKKINVDKINFKLENHV